jgi:hypothetical protein
MFIAKKYSQKLLLMLVALFGSTHVLCAQEGFEKLAKATAEGFEQTNQPNLVIMEVEMKKVRLIWVEFKDYLTGEKKKEPVYYICYRATHRPLKEKAPKTNVPVNELDPVKLPSYFVPIITLVTKSGDTTKVFQDQILLETQKLINIQERREYKNTVEITQPFPPATNDPVDDSNSIYGVAMFRGVDMNVDRFTIFFRGFSNGYQVVEGPDGKQMTLRKTLQQDFYRPGDNFDLDLFGSEVRFDGDSKWIYRPE